MKRTVELSENSVARVAGMANRSQRSFDEVLENIVQKFAHEVLPERIEDHPDYDPDDPPIDSCGGHIAAVKSRIPEDSKESEFVPQAPHS
jgi:hypothetical protein